MIYKKIPVGCHAIKKKSLLAFFDNFDISYDKTVCFNKEILGYKCSQKQPGQNVTSYIDHCRSTLCRKVSRKRNVPNQGHNFLAYLQELRKVRISKCMNDWMNDYFWSCTKVANKKLKELVRLQPRMWWKLDHQFENSGHPRSDYVMEAKYDKFNFIRW